MRAIATTGLKRSSVYPDLPTVDEGGLPGFHVSVWQGMWAPKGTPKPILDPPDRSQAAPEPRGIHSPKHTIAIARRYPRPDIRSSPMRFPRFLLAAAGAAFVTFAAAQQAQKFKDEYVSTEHLLIAIAQEKGGATSRILAAAGVTGWAVGDRVVPGQSPKCGECEYCVGGKSSHASNSSE